MLPLFFRLTLAVTLAFACGACRRATPRPAPPPAFSSTMIPGDFITKPGKLRYNTAHGSVHLDLSQSGARVDWNFLHTMPSSSGRTYGSGMTLPSPRSDLWFIYMENEASFWMYDGGSILRYYSMEASGPKSGSVIRDGTLEQTDRKPPDEVILRLPPDQQSLFPPVPKPAMRPSI